MSESVLKSVLEESARLEWGRYANAPAHVFSKGHERSMQRIFRLYDKNIRRSIAINRPRRIRLTRKTALVLLAVFFLAAVTGCAVAYYVSHSFRGVVHSDNTELRVIDTENCPTHIDVIYYLPEIPKGFVATESYFMSSFVDVYYTNPSTEQGFGFSQFVKADVGTIHADTQRVPLEEIVINGHYGVCVSEHIKNTVVTEITWDNGDYVLQLVGNLDKDLAIELAESAKVQNN